MIFGVLFRVPLLVALSLMLLVVVGLTLWWKNHSLDGVIYQRKPHYHRGFPGEQVAVRLEVANQKLLPLSWLRVQDPWPKAVGPEEEDLMAPSHIPDQGLLTNVFSLRWYEHARRNFTIRFRKRGIYTLGPARLESGDLFGMFDDNKENPQVEYLTVFPGLISIEDLQLPAEDPFGDKRSRRRLYEDVNQPIGLRDYHPEDSLRRIHWPATAHTGQLQVKVYQPSSANILVICLNVSTFSRHWEGTNPQLLEHVIQVSATLAYQGIDNGYRVGLIANGCLAHSDQPFRIPPGRSPKQLARLLEALSGVTPVVTSPFERFLIREVPKLPYGVSLLIVTCVNSPEIAEALVQLRYHGRRVTLLSFAESPPSQISGIRIFHLPFKNGEGN
jgi:uncharacterized protein (DUF58 family)